MRNKNSLFLGLDKQEAIQRLHPLAKHIDQSSSSILADLRIPEHLDKLQKRGVMVLGCTARRPEASAWGGR